MPDEFLTVAEVAAILKLNQQTVRNWITDGELPAVRVGERRVRIRRTDFERLLDQGSSPKAEPAASIWDGEIPIPGCPSSRPAESARTPTARSRHRGTGQGPA